MTQSHPFAQHLSALAFLSSGLFLGCASVQNSRAAVPVAADGSLSKTNVTPAGLRVTGDEITQTASTYFGEIAVTFENPTANWIRIQRVTLDFGTPAQNQGVLLPWGEDLATWFVASRELALVRAQNTQAALTAVELGGVALGTLSRDDRLRAAGGAVALGALAASVLGADTEPPPSFPENHLLAGPFAVPPGLFSKRWLLLNTRAGTPCVEHVVVSYLLENSTWERVLLRFKHDSDWQRAACQSLFPSASRYP